MKKLPAAHALGSGKATPARLLTRPPGRGERLEPRFQRPNPNRASHPEVSFSAQLL